MIYSLFMFKTETNTYQGYFPEFKACTFSGETVKEAVENAQDAFIRYAKIQVAQGTMPLVAKDVNNYLGNPDLIAKKGLLLTMDIDPTTYETRAIKFNITMTGTLLKALDDYIDAHPQYKNRSDLLSEITRNVLAKG